MKRRSAGGLIAAIGVGVRRRRGRGGSVGMTEGLPYCIVVVHCCMETLAYSCYFFFNNQGGCEEEI